LEHGNELVAYIKIGKFLIGEGLKLSHYLVPIVLKPGSLKLLESYAPVQDCNGIASPLPISKKKIKKWKAHRIFPSGVKA
jgi:hypothetical protein